MGVELDIATHALTSFALARGFFPSRGWAVTAGIIVAGTFADADALSALFGAGAYLGWHGTYTHSLPGTLVIVAIATIVALRLGANKNQALVNISLAAVVAAVLHLLLDVCGSDGVTLLWPVRSTRFAADLLPAVDAWILALLILGIVIPELFRLVGSEIGAKDKSPRGRSGATVALGLVFIYLVARYTLHTNAVAEMDAHAYRGETPHRVAAFADGLSIFTWHGIVETQSMMCQLEAPVGPDTRFDPEAASCQHKPEPSPTLDLAQQTPAAEKFLRVARFPRATVERTQDGYEVVIRALENAAEQLTWHRVAAQIRLDAQPRVLNQQLVWSENLGRR
jgi:membrane-bound metal-dependent hydrolase YbcI (DUF457 family)